MSQCGDIGARYSDIGMEFPAISAIAVLVLLRRCVTELLIMKIWVLFQDLSEVLSVGCTPARVEKWRVKHRDSRPNLQSISPHQYLHANSLQITPSIYSFTKCCVIHDPF